MRRRLKGWTALSQRVSRIMANTVKAAGNLAEKHG